MCGGGGGVGKVGRRLLVWLAFAAGGEISKGGNALSVQGALSMRGWLLRIMEWVFRVVIAFGEGLAASN